MSGILMSTARSRSKATPYLADYTASSTGGSVCSVFFNTNGTLEIVENGVSTFPAIQWLKSAPDSTNAALYEIQRNQLSGGLGVTFTGGFASSGTWNAATSRQGTTVTASISVGRINYSEYNIRLAGGSGTVLATCQIDLSSSP